MREGKGACCPVKDRSDEPYKGGPDYPVSMKPGIVRRLTGPSRRRPEPSERRCDMQYMLLIYGDESGNQDRDEQSIEPWYKYTNDVREAGVYIAGNGLLPTSTATTVRVREGRTLTTDGPFAETKEQLGGYYLLDCGDLDEAIQWASKIPSVGRGSVEVRPVMQT